ncbi:hypothetical protein K469DRAFT_696979 [Zopfia rhizophila CBS 207.26]|uniref:Uncharacterized protein n=1 Tax=Zopfia rhizophila CBS 207.26 TaxID=1314779 RepID=A0A6A6EK37_9PEZI|nr:hypothetical protein K469DRAFT_696979 [Zopfia rhizophila CBS 207.26]
MANHSGHEAVVQLLRESQDMLGQVSELYVAERAQNPSPDVNLCSLQPTSDAHLDDPQGTTGVQSIHPSIQDVPLKPLSSLIGFSSSEGTCADGGGEPPSDQTAPDRTGIEPMTPVSYTASRHQSVSCSNGHVDFDERNLARRR